MGIKDIILLATISLMLSSNYDVKHWNLRGHQRSQVP